MLRSQFTRPIQQPESSPADPRVYRGYPVSDVGVPLILLRGRNDCRIGSGEPRTLEPSSRTIDGVQGKSIRSPVVDLGRNGPYLGSDRQILRVKLATERRLDSAEPAWQTGFSLRGTQLARIRIRDALSCADVVLLR
jgi:hypothetical protein